MITLIAAVAANGVIGIGGRLPWSIPDDLRRFRELTTGKPIIMGRATFDSIGRPLPGRTNIFLTRTRGFAAPDVHRAGDPAEAVAIARRAHGTDSEICVIGGGEVYRVFLPDADRLELTIIALAPEGDAFFPEWDQESWNRVAATSHAGPPRYQFTTWDRAAPKSL
jgi:dihydrofolate reductase